MEKLTERILKLKWLIITAVIVLTAVFALRLPMLTINSDLLSSLPDDDPVAVLYKNIGKEFGGNDIGMIALETGNVFTTRVLEEVKAITDSLQSMPGVATVTSLTNIIDIKGGDFGIEIGKLVDEYEIPQTGDELSALARRVFEKDMYRGSIVSEDSTATLITFTMVDTADKQEVAREIKTSVKEMNLPDKLYFGGVPMMMNDVSDLILSDIIRLIPVVFLVIAFVLFFSFRSARGVVMPLLSSGIAIIWTVGIMSFAGYEMTMISNNIPIILFAVGSAYTIHVLNRINQCLEKDRRKALVKAVAYIIVPVFLAAVTTVIGFTSFVFGAYLTMVKDFGMFTALGTFISLLLSVTFIPALIAAIKLYRPNAAYTRKREKENFITTKILKPLTDILFSHPKRIIAIWSVLIIASFAGIFLIHRSVNITEYFKKKNPTRVAESLLQNKFGGSLPVYLIFEGDMQSPQLLKTMAAAEKYMKRNPDISNTLSVADLIEQMNGVMGEGNIVPSERAKIEQLWFMIEGEDIMPQLVSDNLDKGIIQARFARYDTKYMQAFSDYMQRWIDENSTADCKITLTGMPSVYLKMDKSLFNSQMSSLAIALILVLVIVAVILKSVGKGIYATIPILSTIIILFGFMGYAGIALDVATVLVASVALGIGIDYSIHIITHYNHALKTTGDHREAIGQAVVVSGKAIIINVLSVAAGFLVLLFSQMVPLQNFGLLVALSMAGSGAGALTLLPAVILTFKKDN